MEVSISRHLDAAHLNSILNHPDVYQWVKGAAEGPLDLTPLVVGNDDVIPLLGEHGGQIYHRLQPGLFDCHSQFLTQGRGAWAIEATRKTLHWVFTRTEALELLTRVPHGNVAAKALAKGIGGQFQFTNERGWVMHNKPVPADIYSLTVQEWMRTAPGLVERGKWLYERLRIEAPTDETRDRYAGAACDMLLGGQTLKAVALFNRFAAMSWHPPAQIVSLDPVAVQIGETIFEVRGDDIVPFAPPEPTH